MGTKIGEKDQETGNTMPEEIDDYIVNLPRPLLLEEKKFLLAIERGDLPNVRRLLHAAARPCGPKKSAIDVNCVDSLGRGALALAIEAENLEMVELLIVMGVETRDTLLHAIDHEFVEAVELLLEHEELLRDNEATACRPIVATEKHQEANPNGIVHSWQRVDPAVAKYPPGTTPLVLAAQRDNYEILKLLLDRGATLPMPHDIRCGCDDCIRAMTEDPLSFSSTRLSEYRALASPCLIALSSSDPVMTAFQLSWELRELAVTEPETRNEYTKLRRQVEKFAVELLQQARSTSEISNILNYDPEQKSSEKSPNDMPKVLPRLEVAVKYKQKRFVAHAHLQQFLAAIWYEAVPGFRRMSMPKRVWIIIRTALLFPIYCIAHLLAPDSKISRRLRLPFVKFLVHASSYLFFLGILILVSQRAEVEAVRLLGGEEARRALETSLLRQRGVGPSILECLVLVYVLGFVWQETREVYVDGLKNYLRDLWNFIDFTRNSLYVGTAVLRAAAYVQQQAEIKADSSAATIPRELWPDFDPQLIAEGLFAAANVFSALKIVHLFSIDPHLGPLQISLGRMVNDIVKFFFIYTLVLFAFACGLNQLLWYFADLERRKCFADNELDADGDACFRWRRFSSLFESCQSLFWASFGGVGIETFELTGIKSYTRFWGLLMFGSYSMINVIVLLNLLIAMMSNSYTLIEEQADTEWKFARTKLWLSYFEAGGTLPPPFNLIPAPKTFLRLCGLRKKDPNQRDNIPRRVKEHRYGAVMRALVWRYVVADHAHQVADPVTEEDIHELKSDISSWRCELLDIFGRNGMDLCGVNTKDKKAAPGKKMRVWERRLMQDFQVTGPLAGLAEEEALEEMSLQQPEGNEDNVARWKRVARLAVLRSANHRWGQVVSGAVQSSQIGKSNSHASLRSQQTLRHAMEEAHRLVQKSPLPALTSVQLPESTAASIQHVLKDIITDTDTERTSVKIPLTPKSKQLLKVNEVRSFSTSSQDNNHPVPAAVGYVNEKNDRVPLIPKEKPAIHSEKNGHSNDLLVATPRMSTEDCRRKNVAGIAKRLPEISVTSVSPTRRAVADVREQKTCKSVARSPRISRTKSPRRGGGWL